MKAIVYDTYGPPEVLHLEEVEAPTPRDDDVLIRIDAVAVNMGDCEMRRAEIPNSIWFLVRLAFGWRTPRKRILGAYFAGTVDAVGGNVDRFRPGDRVFAASGIRFGAYAERICLPATSSIACRPDTMTAAEAAGVPLGGLNAMHYLREAHVQPAERVLVNGAGGSFGIFAVQLAKLAGAHVTAVDAGHKLEMLRELGADRVIDYERESFADGGETWDVIFNVVAAFPFSHAMRALNDGGRYLLTNPAGIPQLIRAKWATLTGSKRVVTRFAPEGPDDLAELAKLIEAGKLRSIVDRSYPLEQAAEAQRYVETGRKLGNVVLTVG